MHTITVLGNRLHLLPQKAIYIEQLNALLVSDVHLGKAETFQSHGVPIPNTLNQDSLNRLQDLCVQFDVDYLFVLGDLFHSKFALVDEVLNHWLEFVQQLNVSVQLIVGNHDRSLVPVLKCLSIQCILDSIQIDNLVLSHEPTPQPNCLNICGHVHPCVRIKTKLDNLRLPCFYLETSQNLLILPSFGAFTGSYEVAIAKDATAYVIAENSVIVLDA
ncbi:putative phosphoesterase, ICC [Leptolyngbyaceae cyanobacterium JSC-12]|nr:putative phosphoesterase, ICC [Leptolyngbyaceae cyanobacterium JSC-12]